MIRAEQSTSYQPRAYLTSETPPHRLSEWINQFRRKRCADRGGKFPPYLLDFDHVIRDKLDDVCGMRRRTVSREGIRAEIDNCEVACATCNRVKTFGAKYVSMLVYTTAW